MPSKAVILDIETSSLEADAGVMLGAGLLPENGRAEYFGVKRTRDEKDALAKVVSRLTPFDVIVTWNGGSFDIPYLTTRLLSHGLDPRTVIGKRHIDLNEVVKRRLRLTFTYLDHVCDFFRIAKKKGLTGMDVPGLYVRALE